MSHGGKGCVSSLWPFMPPTLICLAHAMDLGRFSKGFVRVNCRYYNITKHGPSIDSKNLKVSMRHTCFTTQGSDRCLRYMLA